MKRTNNKNLPKILFVFQLPPPVHGASMVNKSIKESNLINSSFDCDYVNLTTAKDIKDIGKKSISKYIKSFGIYYKVLKKVFQKKFDLVYLTLSPHGVAFYKDAILAILLKVMRCKLVFHLHGKGIKDQVEKNYFKRKLYGFVFKNVTVIQLSPLLYFDIEKIIRKEDVCFVPNGVKVNDKNGIDKNKGNTILYLSNMQETKGSFTLLQAAKILKELKVDFHINFVGKWHRDSEFKDKWFEFYNNNELQSNITYHGPKYGSEKIFFLKESNCFVLPTLNDCFPISILEAMSFGLPIISTNEGAITEIVKHNENGFIIEKENPTELANRIKTLLENRNLRNEFSKKSYDKYCESYTIEVFEINLRNALCSIIKNK